MILHFLSSFASTLRGRLILLIALATLPTILFIFFVADQERNWALQRTREEANFFVKLIGREHLYQIAGAKSLLQWLSEKLVKEPDATFITDPTFLSSLLAGYPQVGNIAILTAGGDVVNSAHPVSGHINMSSNGAIERALQSIEIETGAYVIGPIVKRPLLHLAKSVRDRDGSVRWLVFVAIDLDWLNAITEKIEQPSRHVLLIVDRNGTVLANSSKDGESEFAAGKSVRLHTTDSKIILVVEDNGVGMNSADDTTEKLGIIGMQERARLVDGTFLIESEKGKGTRIKVEIPRSLEQLP